MAARRSILFLSLATKSSSIIGVRAATTSIFSSILANCSRFHHSSSIVTEDLKFTCRDSGSSKSTTTTTTGNFDWNPQRVTNFWAIVKEAWDPVNRERGDENHWLVCFNIYGPNFVSEQELFDFYVDTLARIFPTKEEARKRIYLVSCEHDFGFGAEFDERSLSKLRGCPSILCIQKDTCYGDRNKDLTALEDVLVVLPDYSFDAKHKGGLVLYVDPHALGNFIQTVDICSMTATCIVTKIQTMEEPVSESVDHIHYARLAWTWKKDPRKYV